MIRNIIHMVLWLSNKIQENDFIFKELQLPDSKVAKKKIVCLKKRCFRIALH